MSGWTRQALQTITTNLDLNRMTFKEAKQAAEKELGRKLSATRREKLVREMFAELTQDELKAEAAKDAYHADRFFQAESLY